MINKQEAKNQLLALTERFAANIDTYKKGNYNEARIRIDYINPFFEALGWDISNKKGLPESYREVISEDKVKVEKETKAPDYCFTIGGQRKFFVEAKQPSVLLKSDIKPAFQLRRYGYSAKMPISLLTDFEELAIYDCLQKPINGDGADTARIKYLTFDNYEKEFDFIWGVFAKENVEKGSFEAFAQQAKTYKGSEGVDSDFLISLNTWREALAIDIAKENASINEEEINFALQKTLDRIIFLRICEDKGLEIYGKLKTAIESERGNYYESLLSQFKEADQKYNSGLFDLDPKNAKADKLTPTLKISNLALKNIISNLYYPSSPYEFSVIPVEILGNVYEQFLGKTIQIDTKHRIKIDEKPEVRKAGGVYYTPQYIVNYIVANTIGKQIEGKTPEEISKISICDPACGSGSFLLGAYQYLLDYHLRYYTSQKSKPKGVLTPDQRLTTKEKKRILLNNIYGVDIDTNAVEVSKLSLMLKALENETEVSIRESLIFNERILPSLDSNIKSGNSLIDLDFYDGQMDFDPHIEKKIKPFNWQQKFPEVFKKGGFDVVIGNPPYVNVENLEENSKIYYFKKYKTCKGRTDIYIAFIENNLLNIKKNGVLSFIIPYAFTNQNYGELLREVIVKKYFVKEIIDTSNYMVFSQANVKNIILTLQKNGNQRNTQILIANTEIDFKNKNFQQFIIDQDNFLGLKGCRFETKPIFNLLEIKEKLWQKSISLDKICLIAYGARLNHKTKKIGKDAYLSDIYEEGFKPFLEGKNIERYQYSQYGWLDYKPEEHYNSMFPELFENEKLVFINVVKDRLRFAYDNKHFYNSHTVINCVRIDKLINATHISARKVLQNANIELCKQFSYKFLLGVLNSNLINWYFINFLSESLHFYPNDAKNLPIPKINLSDKIEKFLHDQIVGAVETLLKLHEQIHTLTLASQKESLQDRIYYLESQIDNWTFDLYGLSEAERKVVGESL